MKNQDKHQEHVRASFDQGARRKAPRVIIGRLENGSNLSVEHYGSSVINAALHIADEKVERYEIVSYGCLHEWAELLDKAEAARLVQGILDEEEATSDLLKKQAYATGNNKARSSSAMAAISDQKTAATTTMGRMGTSIRPRIASIV